MYFTYEYNRDDRVSRLPKRGYERIYGLQLKGGTKLYCISQLLSRPRVEGPVYDVI